MGGPGGRVVRLSSSGGVAGLLRAPGRGIAGLLRTPGRGVAGLGAPGRGVVSLLLLRSHLGGGRHTPPGRRIGVARRGPGVGRGRIGRRRGCVHGRGRHDCAGHHPRGQVRQARDEIVLHSLEKIQGQAEWTRGGGGGYMCGQESEMCEVRGGGGMLAAWVNEGS